MSEGRALAGKQPERRHGIMRGRAVSSGAARLISGLYNPA